MPEAKRNVPTRPETREKYQAYADRRRLKLVEVSDLAIAALTSLTRAQQDQLVETGKLTKSALQPA